MIAALPAVLDERTAFEAWYCADALASCGINITASDMVKLRDGDDYGGGVALNSKWEGWQARAQYTEPVQESQP